jgi:glutaredoxin
MKKILLILIIGTLIFSGFGACAQNIINENDNVNIKSYNFERSTHTVFGEYGTATWCGYCKFAHAALKELFQEGQLDFYYVSLVSDKNSKANTRAVTDYNAYGWPTLWWDGGYKVDVGAGSVAGAKSTYTTSIKACADREVKDVDIELNAYWLGATKIQVNVNVTNNEPDTYGGTIRVYITEKVSSRGWIDSGGQTYTYPFLDWAFNEPISIDVGDLWSKSMTWTGSTHGYPTITRDNTMIIAVVFNDELHQGYSYPPSQQPFDAYYVDNVVATEPIVVNFPPGNPVITGEKNVKIYRENQYTFISKDDNDDDVSYYIDWGDGNTTSWTNFQSSGVQYSESHAWFKEGSYTIKAKAKDVNNTESKETTFSVTVTKKARDKIAINQFLINLLERFQVFNKLIENLYKNL